MWRGIAAVAGLLLLGGCGKGLPAGRAPMPEAADLILDDGRITIIEPWFGGVDTHNGQAQLKKEVRTGTVQVEIRSVSTTPDGSPYLSGVLHIHTEHSSCAGLKVEPADRDQAFALVGKDDGNDAIYWGTGEQGDPLTFFQRLVQPLPQRVEDAPVPLPVASLSVGCYVNGKFVPTGGPNPG